MTAAIVRTTTVTGSTGTASTLSFTTAPPVTYADWKPTTGYTINAGANSPKVAVYDDFFSVARTGTPDMGAVQP